MKSRKYVIILTAILLLGSLTACGSGQETEVKTEVETVQELNETANGTETVVSETEYEETKETTLETEESSEQADETVVEEIVYEGIDMESTLPGVEWIETFVGIIEEPKFVVFNDETNKKVIIEEGEKISYEKADTIAVYLPDGFKINTFGEGLAVEGHPNEHSEEITELNMERLVKENKRIGKKYGGAKFYVKVEKDGVEQQINCIVSYKGE